MINNNDFGGFIVSTNITLGIPIKYSYREQSSIQQLNGWNLLSEIDDDDYIQDANNFKILNMESVMKLASVMYELFNAPYGTDLLWVYEEGVLTGFYDLKSQKEMTIKEIIIG